jgi:hypothetical protein
MELSNLRIAPSCVAPNGFGLFVLDRGYKEGEQLPYMYEGIRISFAQYDRLNDYLVELTNSNVMSRRAQDMHVRYLAKEFDFHVEVPPPPPPRRGGGGGGEDGRINWDAVYDTFISYSFENNSKTHSTVIWPRYNHLGKVLPDERFHMYGLYMNEAPPYEYFYNTFDKRHGLGRIQSSEYNVRVETNDNDDLCFYAYRDIEPFDELLFFYGVDFRRRDYEIKLEGMPFYFDRNSEFERKRVKYRDQGVLFVLPP